MDKKPTAELIAWLDKEIESGKSLLAYENGDAFLEEITNDNTHMQAIKDRLAELEAALQHIANGCLVPPDGGSPCLQDAIDTAKEVLQHKGD